MQMQNPVNHPVQDPVPSQRATSHLGQPQVFVCQYMNCAERGSAKVLAAFVTQAEGTVAVFPSSCQGQCHLGVNVHIPANTLFPRDVWYSQVQPEQAEQIIVEHCHQGHPIATLMNPRMHPRF